MHQALDLILDAIAEEACEGPQPPQKKRRACKDRGEVVVDEVTMRRALEIGRKHGLL